MKKVLFPYVIGQDNKDTFVYAAKMARKMNAELILLSTYAVDTDYAISSEDYKVLVRNRYIEQYNEIHRMKTYYLSGFAQANDQLRIKFDYRFEAGSLINAALSIVQKEEIDLIVITVANDRKDNASYYDMFLTKLYAISATPVYAVPEKYSYQEPELILYSKSMELLNDPVLVIKQLYRFAKATDCEVRFVKITKTKEKENEENEYAKILKDFFIKEAKTVNVVAKDSYEALFAHQNETANSIVAVVKRNKSFLKRFLGNSFTDKVILNFESPVLILMDGL